MPDHVHAVVEGTEKRSDLQRFVRLAKQRSGYLFVRATGEPLWQTSYFDRALRRDEVLADVVRYVIGNPVRAGLVARPADYPHWDSGVWTRDQILDFVGGDPRV